MPDAPAVHQLTRHAAWIGPGSTATAVAGTSIPGGMVYVGRDLRAPSGGLEPALINPALKMNHRRPDHSGASMNYWPSYSEITPEARAAYLSWLAGGRRDPHAYIGYVFLFFYGLERRALADIPGNSALKWELPLLRAEVQRLLDVYGHNGSFRGYATRLIGVLDLLMAEEAAEEPALPPLVRDHRWQTPTALRVELGAFAADGKPVPAAWALAWAWYHPELRLRASATRCLEEFAALFKARYRAAYSDGIVVRPGKTKVSIDYRAASAGIRSASLETSLPNVFEQAGPGGKLVALAEGAMNDLEPYSRYLARNPDGRDTLPAAALLPGELLGEPTGEVKQLRDWAAGLAETRSVTSGSDLMGRWPTKSPERIAKPEAVALAQLLEHFGLGMEPDVRLGGPAIMPATPVVMFRTGTNPPQAATPAYAAATTLLHLATAVSAADGHISDQEQEHLVGHLESSLHLTEGERARLKAHLRWLAATPIKLTGLTRRIEALSQPQRDAVADLLVTVAAADGVISPEEVTSLTKIFRLLALNPGEVHSRLHAHLTGTRPAPAPGPVTVRAAGTPDSGYPIHRPTEATFADADTAPAVTLDLASIEAKFAETAAVSALLSDIFSDDETATDTGAPVVGRHAAELDNPAPGDEASPVSGDEAPPVAGLDRNHSALLRVLAERDAWTRAEFDELTAKYQLMPDGALDSLNEASLDATDEPFLEDDDTDTLTVNAYARQELLA